MKNNPYLPTRLRAKRFPNRMLQSPPSTMGNCPLRRTEETTFASCSENVRIESGLRSNVVLSLYYKVGKELDPYNQHLIPLPAAFSASGSSSTSVGRSPRIEGASIIVNFGKILYLQITHTIL